MRARFSVLLAIVIMLLASCSRTCYCTAATLYMDYVSFANTTTDTIVVRRYTKNSNFASLLDTALLTSHNAVYTTRQDTLSIRPNAEAVTLRSFYDYILYLPAIKRSDSLFGIFETRDTKEGSHDLECTCINRILSFYLNKDTVQVIDPASPHVYINQ